jgi:hypothetical protein
MSYSCRYEIDLVPAHSSVPEIDFGILHIELLDYVVDGAQYFVLGECRSWGCAIREYLRDAPDDHLDDDVPKSFLPFGAKWNACAHFTRVP